MELYLAISCIVISWILGILLASQNLKMLKATKQQRLEARRAYKKLKNEALRKAFNLPKR